MDYFSIRKQFICPTFDLEVEEAAFFEKYYAFLDRSGVGEIIRKHIRNDGSSGGRPNVNYYNLFAVILYGFSHGRSTLRDLEDACGHDIRYIAIMEQTRPSYTTISNFINTVIVPNEKEIFGTINRQIIKEMSLPLTDAFIDGTKWEANANRYKFVWKPETYHRKLSVTFFSLLKENGLCPSFRVEDKVRSSTVSRAIDELEKSREKYGETQFLSLNKSLSSILAKVLEYEEKENICGPDRKSYYKTDHDATAMCLKADYYTGLGSNMHAAYNVQVMVVRGMVLSYHVSSSRTDINDFIPVMDNFYALYGEFPKNVCADSGYGSLNNYTYLQKNGIGNYVKHASWEGNVSGRYPDSYRYCVDGTILCLGGKTGMRVDLSDRHPKHSNGIFFRIDGCAECPFMEYCMRFIKIQNRQPYKIFEVVPEFALLKQEAESNLLSVKGIEIRVNRSIQAEGIFGLMKQDDGYTRLRRRGKEKVSTELMLYYLGLNLRRLLDFYKTGKQLSFWSAPKDLVPEIFKKPSAKRLSQKGKKINEKTMQEKKKK
ncbi:MAG: transposase [Clostridia bacterium]|nr:transposase [Clostridia bacterium]